MDEYNKQRLLRALDDVESHLRKARREVDSGSEAERRIKKALDEVEDAIRIVRQNT